MDNEYMDTEFDDTEYDDSEEITEEELEELIPVYVITGFLESGKTSLINRMLESDAFGEDRKLIIQCEEGSEEYDPAYLKKHNAVLVTFDEKEDMAGTKLIELDKKYKPELVLMEYNAIWTLDHLFNQAIPDKWSLAQLVALIDSTTFNNYMTNMRQIMTDGPRNADLIIVNRCTPDFAKSPVRRQLKGLNPTGTVVFENTDGTSEDGVADEDLPYDMKADIIRIADDQFGTFYLDTMDHADRYDGRTIRIKGQVCEYRGLPAKHYVFGRDAMTCCANDIRGIGFDTRYTDRMPATNQWIELTAKCKKAYSELYQAEGLVLTQVKFSETSAPKEKYVTFN